MTDVIDVGDWVMISDAEEFATEARILSKESIKWHTERKAMVLQNIHGLDRYYQIAWNPGTVEVVTRECITLAYCEDPGHLQFREHLLSLCDAFTHCPFCGMRLQETVTNE